MTNYTPEVRAKRAHLICRRAFLNFFGGARRNDNKGTHNSSFRSGLKNDERSSSSWTETQLPSFALLCANISSLFGVNIE